MHKPGGWTTYSCEISTKAQKAFDEAMEDLIGVDCSAIAVASQVVAGTNYGFFWNATPVMPNPTGFGAVIYVHAPLPGAGRARLVDIVKVDDFPYHKVGGSR